METASDAPQPVYGFDTGFFRRLHDGDPRAVSAWADLRDGDATSVVSCISLFELERLGLRGSIPKEVSERLLEAIPVTCRIAWLTDPAGRELLSRAVRRAHGVGLAMADAIILTSLLDAGATVLFTTDSDFDRYDGPVPVVSL